MARINSDTIVVETKTCGFEMPCCFKTKSCCLKNKYLVSKVRYVVSKLNVIVYAVLKINAWSQNSLVTTMYLVWKHWHVKYLLYGNIGMWFQCEMFFDFTKQLASRLR